MPIEKEQRIFEIASYQFQDGQIVKMMFKYGNDNYYQPSFSWPVVMTLKNTYWKITIGDQIEVPEPTADDFKKLYSGKLLSIVSSDYISFITFDKKIAESTYTFLKTNKFYRKIREMLQLGNLF